MAPMLSETTAGRARLHAAIADDAPGTKFIRVVHLWNGTETEHRTEVLYAGGGLLLAGDAETQLAPIIQTLDTALRNGAALLEIVTQHVTATPRLTIQRYYLYGGRLRTDAAFNEEMLGHDPGLLADAERFRQASRAASTRRVQHAIDERQAEPERSAARIATRADAARSARHEYMAQMTEARIEEADDSAAYAQLQQERGDVLARLLLVVRNGGDIPCDEEPTGEAPAKDIEEAAGPFRQGDRIVCADGVTRVVKGMAPAVTGEPARVIVGGGSEWIAANCLRANFSDILDSHRRSNAAGARVRTEPDPSNPEWRAALAELGEALDYLRKADPTVRVALDEDDAREAATRVHPDACGFQPIHNPGEDEPVAWTFRTGHGAGSRYGVVTRTTEVSPVGLYEYPTTAERAWRRHEAELTR
ncbi:hypothetical protein [Streptomyces sp. NPDC093261]|uniref:hypothetical protein n=1 Tax=Streptomyces sp. NPDC093261 TaxID=3366037 RepID=UPI00382C1963